MPIPLIVIIGNIARCFIQWAVKQLVKKYGKKILIATFREGMRFLVKRYSPQKIMINKGGKKIPFDEWIQKSPNEEIRNFFSQYGVELVGKKTDIPNVQMQSLPKGHLNPEPIPSPNTHISKDIRTWYTLGGYKTNPIPKTNL